MTGLRILTFNWHEAYLCMLAKTGHSFTVVDKIKGGHRGWLEGTRQVPANMRLLGVGSEEDARGMARAGAFDLAICHNLVDLAELAGIRMPKIVVFHNIISTEIALFKAAGRPTPTKAHYISQFLSLFDDLTRAVFISATKQGDAEGIDGRVILPGIDLDEYGGYRGEVPRVLRVGNFFTGRDIMMGQATATAALCDLPATVLGINPELPGSRLSYSWDDLKEQYRSHRVFLNTLVDGYEDGYNLAMLEAMATGMPVVSLPNRTSPVTDGLNGYVSDQPHRLHNRMEALLENSSLARKLGARARETVASKFPMDRFIREWNDTFDGIVKPPAAAKQTREMEPDAGDIAAEPAGVIDLRAEARALMATRRNSAVSSSRGAQPLSDVEAKLGRGRILLSASKYKEAEDHFQHWKDEDPTAFFALLGLGCVDLARGHWEDAERNFRLALQISPDEPNALCGLGLTLGNSGREMEATDALIRSLKAEPARVGTLHALVRAAVTVGRFPDALDAIRNFMQHERVTPELLFSCAALSARQGDKKEALALLDRVEELQPSYPGLAACRSAWSE